MLKGIPHALGDLSKRERDLLMAKLHVSCNYHAPLFYNVYHNVLNIHPIPLLSFSGWLSVLHNSTGNDSYTSFLFLFFFYPSALPICLFRLTLCLA